MDRGRRAERLIAAALRPSASIAVCAPVLLAMSVTCGYEGACGTTPGPRADVELWLGGDVHLGARTSRLFAERVAALRGAAGVVNLEGAVTDDGATSSATRLTNQVTRLSALREAGVRVAGIANNHALDVGSEGPAATARAVRAIGVEPAGGPGGDAHVEVAGRRVVVVAVDLGADVPADLGARLSSARADADVLIASFHVTAPPRYLPTRALRDAVGMAVRARTSIVVAHGTHTYAPVERRGETVIAWGLGNLVFDCECSREQDGLLLRASVAPAGSVRARVVPITAGLGGRGAHPARSASHVFDLLESIGSPRLRREGDVGWF